jgi:hypothetical protein
MSDVQYSTESRHASRNPTPVHAQNESAARPAARQSRRSTKKSTKPAGVSFTAAAIPTSAPRGQRGPATKQSAVTSAISATLTCP